MSQQADNYILTRDASEAERLKILHDDMIACQGCYLYPDIPSHRPGTRISDVATGSGVFLHDLAHAYASAELHGFDISDKIFGPAASLPPSVSLHVADVREPFEIH